MVQRNDEIEKIRKLASEFRAALEKAKKRGELEDYAELKEFPEGSCGETADLLGEYLMESGIENLWYASGRHYSNMQTHAWINIGRPFVRDAIIVDITGDQFQDNPEFGNFNCPVYVGKMSDFHRRFEVKQWCVRHFDGIESYDDPTQSRLSEIYAIIEKHLAD